MSYREKMAWRVLREVGFQQSVRFGDPKLYQENDELQEYELLPKIYECFSKLYSRPPTK